jgi:hypothetical protein
VLIFLLVQTSENATLFIGVFGSSRLTPGSQVLFITNTLLFLTISCSLHLPLSLQAAYSLVVTTGCKTYSECSYCVSDPGNKTKTKTKQQNDDCFNSVFCLFSPSLLVLYVHSVIRADFVFVVLSSLFKVNCV